MKLKLKVILPFLILSVFHGFAVSEIVEGAEIKVGPQETFKTIANALTQAENNTSPNDTILLQKGTFRENVVLISGVTLKGDKGANAVVKGSGTGTVITAADGSSIQNLTVTDGDVGVLIPIDTNVTLNNVIITQQRTFGIQCENANSAIITNNTLHQNGIAISCTNSSGVTIKDNLITNNTNDFILNNSTNPNVGYNLFFGNSLTSYADANIRTQDTNDITDILDQDPLYVDSSAKDFHLKVNSAAIGKNSNGGEIGAFGGNTADLTLFPVLNLRVTNEDTNSISIAWDPNLAHTVKGYKILYDSDVNGPPYSNSVCKITNPSYQITNLSGTVATPPPPSNFSAGIGNQEITLNWTPFSRILSVAEYTVYYRKSSESTNQQITVPGRGNASSTVTNLENFTTYIFQISTVAKPPFFVTVTALSNEPTDTECPNTQPNESQFATEVEGFLTTPASESSLSPEISATPEPAVRFPALDDEGGCFIASLAFGSPLETYLKTLRNFRDQFLLKNSGGRKLTKLYYQVSPSAHQWLEQNQVFKPYFRILLYPMVWIISIWMSGPIIWTLTLGTLMLFFLQKFFIRPKVFLKLGASN